MSNIENAIYNCRESLIPRNGDRSDKYISEQLNNSNLMCAEGLEMYTNLFDRNCIIYFKPTEENKFMMDNFFHMVEHSVGKKKLVIDRDLFLKYTSFIGYTGNPEFPSSVFSNMTNSTIFIQQNFFISTYFHEYFLYFMMYANSNQIIFVNEQNQPSVIPTLLFYIEMFNLLTAVDLPAYLKVKVSKLVSSGTKSWLNFNLNSFKLVDVVESKMKPMSVIRLDAILSYITMSVTYKEGLESFKIVCRKSHRSHTGDTVPLDVNGAVNILDPITMFEGDSFLDKGSFKTILEKFYDASYLKNGAEPVYVNDFRVASTANPLSRIYKEAFLQVCTLLSYTFYSGSKKIYMQDIVMLEREGIKYLSVLPRSFKGFTSRKTIKYHIPSSSKDETKDTLNRLITVGSTDVFLAVNDRYYTEDIDCSPLTEDEFTTIKECAVYRLSTYMNYTEELDLSFISKVLPKKVSELRYKNSIVDMLNYNNNKISSCVKSCMHARLIDSPLGPFGGANKYSRSSSENSTIIISV